MRALLPIQRSLVSIETAKAALNKSEDAILGLIESGKLRFAFDLGQTGSHRRLVRIFTLSICDYVNAARQGGGLHQIHFADAAADRCRRSPGGAAEHLFVSCDRVGRRRRTQGDTEPPAQPHQLTGHLPCQRHPIPQGSEVRMSLLANPPKIAQESPERPNTLPPPEKFICRPSARICMSVWSVFKPANSAGISQRPHLSPDS